MEENYCQTVELNRNNKGKSGINTATAYLKERKTTNNQ